MELLNDVTNQYFLFLTHFYSKNCSKNMKNDNNFYYTYKHILFFKLKIYNFRYF